MDTESQQQTEQQLTSIVDAIQFEHWPILQAQLQHVQQMLANERLHLT